jgi:multidrug resistance efflux pump
VFFTVFQGRREQPMADVPKAPAPVELRGGRREEAGVELLSERVRSLRLPPEAIPGGYGGGRLAWSLCLLFACSTAVLAYLLVQHQRSEGVGNADKAKTAAVAAKTTNPQPDDEADSQQIALQAKGYVVPVRQTLVSPKVSGMIVALYIQEGQSVRKGDLLAEIEDTEYREDYERANAAHEAAKWYWEELQRSREEEVHAAQAELEEAQAQLPQLEAEWRRTKELAERRVISQEDYERAESRYQAMQARVRRLEMVHKLVYDGPREERRRAAKAELDRAAAEVRKAKWRLDNCQIFAPISGTILKKNAEKGNIVNPIALQGSFSICEMADLRKLEVEVTIQEESISRVFARQRCEVWTEAFPTVVYSGYVSRLMPIADRAKGAVPVRVRICIPPNDEGKYFKPEMGAMVKFFKDTFQDAMEPDDE